MALAEAGLGRVWLPGLAALVLGALIPLWTYPILRFGGKFSPMDAAAIRLSLPDANPTFYLTASLAVTFPFNIALGIPVYFAVARHLYA